SIPGVLAGSQLTTRVPDRALRVGLGSTLLLSGLKLLDVPGANALVVAGLAAGLLVGLGALIRVLVRATVLAPRREL
nr:sulfite exporter TauE/SafE family protein [Actinomycetota bacterium]